MSRITRRRALQTGTAAIAVAAAPRIAFASADVVKLRVLETTDLHVNVSLTIITGTPPTTRWDWPARPPCSKPHGAKSRTRLLFDNGDLIQGSPLGDYTAYRRGMKNGDVHPMVAAMNALPYDCGTVGNHEFNYGLEYMANSLATAKFPIVCANLLDSNGRHMLKPWLVLDREFVDEAGVKQAVKVGVIGFVPPQIMQWDKANLDGKASTIDIVDAAEKHVPDLKKAGAEIVVALCHSGIAGGERKGGEENAALHLAKVDGIDVILTGHQHFVFPGGKEFANIPGVDARKARCMESPP